MKVRWMSLSVRLATVAALAVGMISILDAASVSALVYEPKGSFCEPTGLGSPPCSPETGRPVALTVDPTNGDLVLVDLEAKTIRRFKPDGTPDNFSALGVNTIDGKRSGSTNECPTVPSDCDETPQNELKFAGSITKVQIAIAPPGSAGGTAGDIYVAQFPSHLVNVFAASGKYLGQLTTSAEGALGETSGVSVDPSGAFYVSDFTNNKIHKYIPNSNVPFSATNTDNFSYVGAAIQMAGVGPSAGALFVENVNTEVLKRINSSTGLEECEIASGVGAVAEDSLNGHAFVTTESEVQEFDGSCPKPTQPLSNFTPGGNLRGIAVNGVTGRLYVSKATVHTIEVWEAVGAPEAKTLEANPVEHEGATLRGEANPNGQALTKCFFEWGKATEGFGNEAPCVSPNAAEVGSGSSFVPVHAPIGGLEPGTAYHFRLVVANSETPAGIKGEPPLSFTTTGPAVSGEGVIEVGATSARVGATVDPNGEATEFRVQYLSDAAFQANPPGERFAGAAQAPSGAPRTIPAAVAGTGNVTEGSLFITEASATAGAFGPGETISGPGIKAGTTIKSLPSPGELELSKGATATTKSAALSATGPQPVRQLIGGLSPNTTYHFRFTTHNLGGTTTGTGAQLTTAALPEEALEPGCPNAALRGGLAATLPDCRAYELVSPPVKAGEVVPPEPNSELGGTCNPSFGCLPGSFERSRPMQSTPDGNSVLYSGQPFFAGLPGGQNAYLSGREASGWGLDALNPLATTGNWEAFSSDLSRGVLGQTEPALSPLAPTRGGAAFANLYLDAGGTLTPLITAEPPNRDPGGTNRFKTRFAAANSGTPTTGALTHVAFEANDALTGATTNAPAAPPAGSGECIAPSAPCNLYVWSGGQLALINAKNGSEALGEAVIGGGRLLEQEAGLEAGALDNAISADGSRIFWSSGETGHVYARVNGAETLEVPGPASCKASVALASRACFLTASADGEEVLLSNGELFELNGAGTAYALKEDLTEGEGGFEGYLASGEEGGHLARIYFVDPKALPGAAANADGEVAVEQHGGNVNLYYWHAGAIRFVAALLAGDDRFGEHFGDWRAPRADRTAQASGDGRFLSFMSRAPLTGFDNTCATAGGSTVCPEVFEYAADSGELLCPSCNPSGQAPLGRSNLSRLGLAAPGSAPDFRQPQNLPPSGNGRLFFESQDALLPQDTNGHIQDVYEWEPAGVGTCAKAAGCLRLISSGSSATDSMFMDASASGNDAFFITRQRLVGADENSQLDLYDARVLGGFASQGGPAPCSGEGCREALAESPAQPSAASQSFTGPGNPKQPKKKHKPAHHKKKKHKKQKRHRRAASHNRAGGRK